ncbi:ABC transporter ATP-binding protein [Dehalogenimonas etheniformans]|uniref:ABC transporter ATP-binding protein n=1 Tax=Dehalogenimonas etheniformans TaxID=1536648 RepID=A0A2P5P8H2_9CHLR|nr:ABC transporter ATP-binding protein [Dehalogenimonas etheniformans]PPD58594.1 ABC transporter ATP-binding protein [Dehalogenimonas etheniformans]QNT76641.1 ABC transporter ATP-binding protein [Dehalogenimonas etheniformans]
MSMVHGFPYSLSAPDEKPRVTLGLLKRVLGYARPYTRLIVLMFAITVVVAGLSLLMPLILRQLIDHTLVDRNLPQLWWLVAALVALPIATSALNVLLRRINAGVGEGVVYDLRVALFSHLQRMALNFFTNTKVGELMSRLNNDVVGAQNAISNTMVGIVSSFIQTVALLVVMFSLEWRLTLLSIVILPLFLVAARNLGRRLQAIAREQLDLNAKMNAVMHELLNISGALLVKLFGRASTEDERFKQRAAAVRDAGVRRAVTGMLFFASIGLISAIGVALVYGLGGYLVIMGTLSIGTIVAMAAYLGSLYSALQNLTNAPVDFATSMVSFERVFEVIDLPHEIGEKPGALKLEETKGVLEFEDVSFQYPKTEKSLLKDVKRFGQMQDVVAVLSGGAQTAPANGETEKVPVSQAREQVLDHVSFRAEPGQLVALVGPSGAGKTTLTYLIPRLYDPTSGQILIDGHDLRDVTLDSLANQIGMVTQETFLFHDTIRVNMLYADPDATPAQVQAAARAANIHDFIMGLPKGYDTVVGERGYRLSGGEKQRIALARVILKNPRILVLDEATSSLDSESEALIQEALKRVMAGRTSIVIAHRLSTILAADIILVMDRGQIIERGNHQQLLARGGLYARLYETQFHGDKVSSTLT